MITSSFNSHVLTLDYLQGLTKDINKTVKRASYSEAVNIYRKAKEKLLDVSAWNEDPRLHEFDYTLMDSSGNLKRDFACEGDYIRFKLNPIENKLCWVKIERILEVSHHDWKSFAIRLEPMANPAEAKTLIPWPIPSVNQTNTLIIERTGNKVVSFLHQRTNDIKVNKQRFGIISKFFRLFSGGKEQNCEMHSWENIVDTIL